MRSLDPDDFCPPATFFAVPAPAKVVLFRTRTSRRLYLCNGRVRAFGTCRASGPVRITQSISSIRKIFPTKS